MGPIDRMLFLKKESNQESRKSLSKRVSTTGNQYLDSYTNYKPTDQRYN